MDQLGMSISPDIGISLQASSHLQSQDSIDSTTSHNSPGTGGTKTKKNDSDQPKKKRRSTIRACDGCAIRKIKCEVERPCHHCVANGLKCTQLRERKKSGPKNLHKKTLESINNLSHKITEANQKFDNNHDKVDLDSTLIASNHQNHPIELVPDALSNRLLTADNKLTSTSLIEILNLVNEPIINTILKEYTIKSLIDNSYKLVEFINAKLNNIPLDNITNSNDPIYLSKILLILSLCLLVIEHLLKLIQLNLNLNYSFVIHSTNYYKNFKKVLLFKIIDIFSIIDKLLLYPNFKYNKFQIFYNESISCINLFGYFDLITKFNNNNHNDNKEEIDIADHNELYLNYSKVYYIRKAVSFYHFVDLKNEFIINKNDLTNFQLNELFEKLFTLERFNYFISPEVVVSVNLLDMNFNLNSTNAIFRCFKLINSDPLILNNLKSFNILKNLNKFFKIHHYPDLNNLLTKKFINLKISLINYGKDNIFNSVIIQLLIFKILMIYSNNLELNYIESELIEIVRNLNQLIKFNDLFILKFSDFKLVPQFLQILKINIDFENNLNHLNDLIVFTKTLFQFFKTTANVNQIIKSNIVIYEWFEEMKKMNSNEIIKTSNNSSSSSSNTGIISPMDDIHLSSNVSKVPATRNLDGIGFVSKSVPLNSNNNSNYNSGPNSLSTSPKPNQTLKPKMLPPQTVHQQQYQSPLPLPPQQLHYQLNKLQQSQFATNFESNKDKTEINELLNDFGNSNLSSKSSTNTNSIVVTTNPTPERSNTPLKDVIITTSTNNNNNNNNNNSNNNTSNNNPNVLQNSNSTSYSTIIQSNSGPAPPIITAATAINQRNENDLTVSESTKSLYNLFTQINDDVGTSNSLTNLFQFNSNINNNNTINSNGNTTSNANGNGSNPLASSNSGLNFGSSLNLPKLSSLSTFKSSNNLNLINSSSTLNLFLNRNNIDNDDNDETNDNDKIKKKLKHQFLL